MICATEGRRKFWTGYKEVVFGAHDDVWARHPRENPLAMIKLCWQKNTIKILLCGLCILFAGCGMAKPRLIKLSSPLEGGNCRVALLPFINESKYPRGDTILYRLFVSELVRSGKFQVAAEGETRKILRQMKVYPNRVLDIEQTLIVADRLNAELVISGTIHEMDEEFRNKTLMPSLVFSVNIYDATTGRILWTTYHKGRGDQYRWIMHFGMINTISALARQMSEEVVNLWTKEGLGNCEQ